MPRALLLPAVILLAGCGSGAREVLRQRSPDGKIDAMLLERLHGDTVDYEVRAEPVDAADGQGGTLLTWTGITRGVVCPRPYALRWTTNAGPNGASVRVVSVWFSEGRPELNRTPPQFRSGPVLAQFGIESMPEGTRRCPDAPAPKETR